MREEKKAQLHRKNEVAELRIRVRGLERADAERQQVEKALRESEEFSTSLLNSSPNPILVISPNTSIRYVNPAFEELTGFYFSKLAGVKAPYPWWIEDDSQDAIKSLEKAMRKKAQRVERLFRKKNGNGFWVQITSAPVLNGGELKYNISNWVDITKPREAEKALRESEEKYRALTERSPDIIMRFDRQCRLVYVNSAIKKVFKSVPNSLIGKNFRELKAPANMCTYWESKIKEVFDTGIPCEEVFEFKGESGRIIFDWKLVPECNLDEKVETVMSSARDITEHKKAAQALIKREKELKIKTINLLETNTALKVLLKKRDEDRMELEEKVLANVKELVLPYLEKLKKAGLTDRQKSCADILESNLEDIISPFSRRMSPQYLGLTPAEIRVANLVKHGKSTKDIAEFLNLSLATIESHRRSIRKKIGIRNRKANLRTHLISFQ